MQKYILSVCTLVGLMLGSYGYAIDVSSCTDLANINNNLTADYVLTQDLDCSGSGNSIMIGSAFPIFEGTFDGSGYTITVDIHSTGDLIGLFRRTDSATISNLSISGSIISTYTGGLSQLGGVVGFAEYTTLDNVHVTADIIGYNSNIGGIAGYTFESIITGSSADITIIGSGGNSYRVGGLVGNLSFSDVFSSSAIGTASGFAEVGGLAGYAPFSSMRYSYADVDIAADNTAGGLAGIFTQGLLNDAYALGDVTINNNRVGGLIGAIGGSTLARTYAKGVVTGATFFGGLVGSDDGANTFSASFWDIDTSGILTDDIGATGLNTYAMQDINTFSGAGWDFDTIWDINSLDNDRYPFLQWQTFNNPPLSEIMIYMNNNTPGAGATQYISIEYVNGDESDLTDVILTLYGDIYATGFQEASGLNNPTFSGIAEGSYVQWTIPSFPKNTSGVLDLIITQPIDGSYVYTATIAAPNNTELYPGNNSFSISTTVDTVTQTPTLLSPIAGTTYVNDSGMSISFVLPETLLASSLGLSFILAEDLSGAAVTMNLMDANPIVTNTFSLLPNNVLSATEVVSSNLSSIPNGTYNVILSYQDIFGNPAASATITGITIIDNPGPYVLTEVNPISSSVRSSSVMYSYSSLGTGDAELLVGDCGSGVNVVAESIIGNGSTRSVQLSNLQVGQTYQCTLQIRSIGGMSNILTMGPFTVKASGGGGGGGSSNIQQFNVITPTLWRTFYAEHMSGDTSAISGEVFTVKAFVTDVFRLLGVPVIIQWKEIHSTQVVPDSLVKKVWSILKNKLGK